MRWLKGRGRFDGSWLEEVYFLFFKIVGAHPASSGVIEAEVLWALERRVAALERQLREHQEALYASPSFALRELKRQVDSFKNKLEHNDQLSWLSKFASYIYIHMYVCVYVYSRNHIKFAY